MLKEISTYLIGKIQQFPISDRILFNNKVIEINKDHFQPIPEHSSQRSIAFIDGGQAEIISAGNFCLSFIRFGALVYRDNKIIKNHKHEFYLLTAAKYEKEEVFYESKLFFTEQPLIDEKDLEISSTDATIKIGMERASINAVASMARRFAELSLCGKVDADIIVLDGTLESSYRNEEKYLSRLPAQVCALAKSSSLFTASGNSPLILLNKLGPISCWSYYVENNTYFVKLHVKSKHVFRFTGSEEFLPLLAENSTDALFLGYPYGLIAVDRFARVSNEEQKSLRMNILLKAENKEITEYLSATNAHDILDRLG